MSKVLHKLSAQKLAQIKKEIEDLKTKGRKEIEERLKSAQHDIVEELDNPSIAINEDRFFLENKISELEEIIANSVLVDKVTTNKGVIELGTKVKVGFENYEEEYIVVDPIEADPLIKKIASDSPVGSVLLGKKTGETVIVDVCGIKKSFLILSIN